MKIKIDNKIEIDGQPIPMYMDMYSLTYLTERLQVDGEYRQPISALYRNKSFLEMLSYYTQIDFTHTPNVVREMKRHGIYKTIGRGNNMRVYCNEDVLFCIMMSYSTSLKCDLIKGLFSKDIENQK